MADRWLGCAGREAALTTGDRAGNEFAPAPPALDDREFSITRKGYDRQEVKAFLAEIESSFQQLEAWARRANARLSLAEDRGIAEDEINEAMLAIFDSKERVLERARRRADRIEADASAKAHTERAEVIAEMISQAEDEARRIIQAALSSTEPVTEESILAIARAEADRLLDEAQTQADRVLAEAQKEAERLIAAAQASAASQASEPLSLDPSRSDDGTSLTVVIADAGREQRPSRYERTSAGLPSIGEDASKVAGSLERIREEKEPTLWERLGASFTRRT